MRVKDTGRGTAAVEAVKGNRKRCEAHVVAASPTEAAVEAAEGKLNAVSGGVRDMTNDGELCVLSCGRGDLRIHFNTNDPQDVERARRMIDDLLKRGYILFVEDGDKTRRVKRFNATTDSYIVVEGALYSGAPDDTSPGPKEKAKGKTAAKEKSLPMRKTKALAVAPTAGG